MAGSFGTQLDTMQAASQHVLDVNANIQAQLSSLLQRLEPLAGLWKGDASMSFQALAARWNEDASRLSQALQGIGEALMANQQTYSASESTNQASFSKITQALG